ncbi:MAG: ribonucleotide-diphosphate reductase subunit beta [Candidatus Falkowbacteria bacterium]|nr:ribonucleotide-diphosphate reductase subunit beta [Candidatus Falkowbacteria bacterium]
MQKNKIFNPNGDDSLEKRSIILGGTTGLFNLNSVKYTWAPKMYRLMTANFWLPEKVSGLKDDAAIYKTLSPDERRAYNGVLSFLIFLDSVQTVNLPNFSNYITASEVNFLLAIQTFQEAIHSQSYATLLETIVSSEEREEIYYFWRQSEILKSRNEYIGHIYQEFADNPSQKTFFRALVGNFLLEGLYFYNGFAFFDTLAFNGKMLATGRMINYIRRDEITHIVLFSNIIKEIRTEFDSVFDENELKLMFQEAVEQEIIWANHILGENIPGMSPQTIIEYTKYLANERLAMLKIEPLYPEIVKNPYKHLEVMADNNSEKTNFFESTVTNYTQSNSLKGGWDF